LTNEDNKCASCGASITPREETCSFCGKTIEKTTVIPHDTTTYGVRQSEDGMTHVSFGDGDTGKRPPAGIDNVSASHRVGKGATEGIKCPRCMTVQKKSNKKCERCGSSLTGRRFSFRIRSS